MLSSRGPREGNGTHSSTLAWKIPWTEKPGGLQSMGSLRVGHYLSNLAVAVARDPLQIWEHIQKHKGKKEDIPQMEMKRKLE